MAKTTHALLAAGARTHCVYSVQVRPNVHKAFHSFINAKLQDLEAEREPSSTKKRKSDAKVIAAICQEMVAQVEAHPEKAAEAAEEFSTYQVVCVHALCSLTAFSTGTFTQLCKFRQSIWQHNG